MLCGTTFVALLNFASWRLLEGFQGHVARVPAGVDGGETRGKTAQNRLRALDVFVGLYDKGLFASLTKLPLFVDLGFGDSPVTTLESARMFRRHLNAELVVCGVEYDPDRVARAAAALLPHEENATCFVQGGFKLPIKARPARLIRAMNVLRQYEPDAVQGAHAALGGALTDGGLVLEGTCGEFGRRCVVHALRKHHVGSIATNSPNMRVPEFSQLSRAARIAEEAASARAREEAAVDARLGPIVAAGSGWVLVQEAVVFYVAQSSRRGGAAFSPSQLRAVLPKAYINNAVPGEPIDSFLELWEAMHQRARDQLPDAGTHRIFTKGVQSLAERVPTVCASQRLLRRGFVVWKQAPYKSGEPTAAAHGALAAASKFCADNADAPKSYVHSTLLYALDENG